jgi:hypothetical protein
MSAGMGKEGDKLSMWGKRGANCRGKKGDIDKLSMWRKRVTLRRS